MVMVSIIKTWKGESVHNPIPYCLITCDTQRADICMTVYKALELNFIFYCVLHLLVLFTILLAMMQRMCCFLARDAIYLIRALWKLFVCQCMYARNIWIGITNCCYPYPSMECRVLINGSIGLLHTYIKVLSIRLPVNVMPRFTSSVLSMVNDLATKSIHCLFPPIVLCIKVRSCMFAKQLSVCTSTITMFRSKTTLYHICHTIIVHCGHQLATL